MGTNNEGENLVEFGKRYMMAISSGRTLFYELSYIMIS